MAERADVAPDLPGLLMGLCDDDASRLRGAVCAAYGIADALFAAAVEGATITPAHTGLRWALEEVEAAVAELSERLREAHRLAREQAGGAPPPTS